MLGSQPPGAMSKDKAYKKPAQLIIVGPEGESKWYEMSRPATPLSMACKLALANCAGKELCHKRADTAGSIMRPTAISVPRV